MSARPRKPTFEVPVAERHTGDREVSVHALDELLSKLRPSEALLPGNRIRTAAFAYNSRGCAQIAVPPTTDEERRALSDWLRHEREAGLQAARPTREPFIPLLHETWIAKVHWLWTRPCDVCDTRAGPGIQVRFMVPIEPFTAQTSSSRLRNLKARVRERLRSQSVVNQRWRGVPVCLTVIAALGVGLRSKDADNLVKALLDAMQDVLFQNDDAVQHLNVVRLRPGTPDGFYAVSARPIRALEDDIVDCATSVRWRTRISTEDASGEGY